MGTPPTRPEQDLAGPAILLATPRDPERALLAYVLAHEGYGVREAASAAAAVRLAQETAPRLVVLDTAFWQSTELDVLASLTQQPQTKGVPVMLFGDPVKRDDLVAGLQAGAAAWVSRTGFDVAAFLDRLHTVLDANRGVPRVAAETPRLPAKQASAVAPSPHAPAAHAAVAIEKLVPARIGEVVAGLGALAAFEFNIVDAITTTCAKDRTVDHVLEIVLRDPVLLLALLSAANATAGSESAGRIIDPRRAMEAVGAKQFYVLAESVTPLAAKRDVTPTSGHLWAHSVATARLAAVLATRLGIGSPSEVAAAGLLHDVGYTLLANHFPQHLQALHAAAPACECPHPAWETEQLGLHHGELAACVFRQFGLPDLFQDVASVHHDSVADQPLGASTRIGAMIVQAADQMADALFPGDPPLTLLSDLAPECVKALQNAEVAAADLWREGHKIVTDLVAEMIHLFPAAAVSPCYYAAKPLAKLIYYAAPAREHDLIRAFFETRCQELRTLPGPNAWPDLPGAPVVVNLTRSADLNIQLEVLTSLMAAGLMRRRRGIVLLPGPLNPVHAKFASDTWRLLSLPTHPPAWMPWLAGTADQLAQTPPRAHVA
jgi:putative nucleotidyltransferase with HDIG domain